jgi:dipeptidyl-peptidase-4
MKRAALTLALLLAASAGAQRKQLTLETIYDPTTKVYFSGVPQNGFEWLDDSTFIWPKRDAKGKLVEWERFDVKSGSVHALFDRAAFERALRQAGASADEASGAAKATSLRFDAKKSAVVVEAAGDLFLYSLATQSATRLTSTPAPEEVPQFSPDGKRIAFVRQNNLYVIDLASQRERQLTTDGSATVLNGVLDWVYEEEVYGRGTKHAFWWSPDSSRIAFLRTDEREVPAYPNVDQVPYHPVAAPQFYPKAGDPNPHVRLLIAPAGGGEAATIDNDRYTSGDFLIVRVAWNRDGSALMYQTQNREQTWLDLNRVDAAGGAPATLIHETTKAWVEPLGEPVPLADGSFLWQSERSGYRHLYLYKADGTPVRQVTNGEWEVRDLHGVDEKGGWIYFSGTERSPIGLDVYRIKMDGSGLQRISETAGTHAAKFNSSFTSYVDSWNDINTPSEARLHNADGSLAKLIDANLSTSLAEYDLPRPELLQVKARDGFVLEAMMIKPSNFDASKKYPVYEYHYGGPHAQQVTNGWKGTTMQFLQLIAQQGVVVWVCDNRAASGKGAVSAWTLYKHFGEVELRDMEDGLTWLAAQPFIDGSRIMTYGWSYGGYMTSYALTHSKKFVAGIAGGTVADWRDYDSVYTERYMLMPQNNADAYKSSSPRWAAKELHGNLLLIHGAVDDNVHPQNTMQFVYELEKAQVPFEMKLYPKQQHGVRDPALVYDLQKTILAFVKANLLR